MPSASVEASQDDLFPDSSLEDLMLLLERGFNEEDDEIDTCIRGIESDILLGSQEEKENYPNQRSIFNCKHCAKG